VIAEKTQLIRAINAAGLDMTQAKMVWILWQLVGVGEALEFVRDAQSRADAPLLHAQATLDGTA
jgi:hypothetical protein